MINSKLRIPVNRRSVKTLFRAEVLGFPASNAVLSFFWCGLF